jgi:hypothetical protein
MSLVRSGAFLLALLVAAALGTIPVLAQTDAKPNILVIMGDDIIGSTSAPITAA